MKRLEFHISYGCLNNCVFCSEADQLEIFKNIFVKKDIIFRQLRHFEKKGFNHLSLTGGEPTLHPYFYDIILYAKKAGFKTYVSSNGGFFNSRSFCRKTLPYLDEISFSLHGPDAKMHNYHTQNNTSFLRLTKALTNIEEARLKPFVFINMVATTHNFKSLPKMINTATRFKKVRQILISNLAPEGMAKKDFNSLAVPLKLFKDNVSSLVNLANKRNINIRFFGVPLCFLKPHPEASNDLYWSPRVTLELWKTGNGAMLKKTTSLKPDRKRTKIDSCNLCLYKDICGGIFNQYLSKFGSDQIKPYL